MGEGVAVGVGDCSREVLAEGEHVGVEVPPVGESVLLGERELLWLVLLPPRAGVGEGSAEALGGREAL